jgi:hypothetical protein
MVRSIWNFYRNRRTRAPDSRSVLLKTAKVSWISKLISFRFRREFEKIISEESSYCLQKISGNYENNVARKSTFSSVAKTNRTIRKNGGCN